ncbi:MAG: YkgJ family cysteine cluster protein [Desulfovibrio sp.]|jgi:Fe-S-cluster containining protein|nr:YkgJ family cysteine cluster protein [Desulfovibrio sp.]
MVPDIGHVLERYATLRNEADAAFAGVRSRHPDCVRCHEGCSDCCHALFDLSLVEAIALNRAFADAFGHGPERSDVLTRAAETDRQLTRIKREMFRAERDGEPPEAIMERAARIKVRCPLLDGNDRCLLYADRPVTCRVYGVPTAIAGRGHVCGLSAFTKGTPYPTVHMDKLNARLEELSRDIARTVESRFTELAEVYVPVSMALLTTYDEAYLGIGPAGRTD